jgi:hypothetical protein
MSFIRYHYFDLVGYSYKKISFLFFQIYDLGLRPRTIIFIVEQLFLFWFDSVFIIVGLILFVRILILIDT